jgi:hypothetical protein
MQPAVTLEREPPVWRQLATLTVLFLGGGAGGVLLAEHLAPDSIVAAAAGLFALPFTFALGLQLWLGTGLLLAIVHRLRGRTFEKQPGELLIPGGAFVFVPLAVALNGAAGLVVAIAGSSIGWLATLLLYPTLGGLYGMACRRLARAGYIPMPH